MVKITNFTVFTAEDNLRLSYTYSIISENGTIEKSNIHKDVIVVDTELKKEIYDIFNFLEEREVVTE